MTPERRNQIDKLLQRTLDLAPPRRAAFLDEACAGDVSLRREVESLLSARSSLMASPLVDAETEVAMRASDEGRSEEGVLVGRRMGRYRFLALLGEGGMGQVYLAHDTRLGRKVAIKVLLPELTKNEMLLHRFEQEARAASALNHPNILTVYDIGEIDSLHFIATEYVQGETLGHLLSNSTMTIDGTLDIAAQVAGALAEAHRAGIVHRDIKPTNIMLRPDGAVKVIDFGLAKLVEPSSANYDVPRMTMVNTEPGIVMGTPFYMSPEQLRGSQLDGQTDIFSFGVMLYQMISGKLPFRGSSQSEVIAAILTEEPKPVSQYIPNVLRDLDQLVSKALQKTKEARYQEMKDLLSDLQALKRKLELGASPPIQTVRLEDTVRTPQPESHPDNLPIELTSFVGREAEIAAVSKLLLQESTRLLTLTGTGGVGKTRFCLQVAARVADQFSDGVHFVPLASINDSELIGGVTAQKLGVRETAGYPLSASLKEHLSGKHTLLVFDNFEQVIAGAPLLTELLTDCPRLKVLVTSRVLLHLRGECEFEVPPLELPDLKSRSSVEDLLRCPAVLLFTERARAVSPGFVVTNENARAVAEICVRLDGLPLALELAAPRLRLLSPKAILAHLDSRLDLLTRGPSDLPTRQRTMRSAIAWSYDLLDAEAKRLFRYLSVFVGGFTLEAAESVCGDPTGRGSSVLDGLSSLLENSLLRSKTEEEPRFVMLETIREFASERLAKSRKTESIRRAHALFFSDLVEKTGPHLKGTGQASLLQRLEVERGNLRAALSWAKETGDIEMGLLIAAAHGRFWWARGHLSEGRRWLEEFLVPKQNSGSSIVVRAKGLYEAGVLAYMQNDYDHARARLEESRVLYQQLKDNYGVASSLNILGLLAHDQSDNNRALALLEEGLELSRELRDEQGIAFALGQLGIVEQEQGNYQRAMSLHEESAAIRARLEDGVGSAAALNNAGLVALDNCEYQKAGRLFDQALALSRKVGYKAGVAASLNNLGELAQHRSNYVEAKELFTEALTLFGEEGDKRDVAAIINNLADLAQLDGDYVGAARLHRDVLMLLRNSGESSMIASCLEGLASLACERNHPDVATRILGSAEALREAIGIPLPLTRRNTYESTANTARIALGEAAFSATWQEGRAMTIEHATNVALEFASMMCDVGIGSLPE